MKYKGIQILFFLFVGICVALPVLAQERPAGPSAGGSQKLTGQIRWKRSLGVIPSSPGAETPHASPCSIFWIAAQDPAADYKLVWFANALEPAPDEGDYYVCKYSLILPVGKQLRISAGMGAKGLFALPETIRERYYYDNSWIGDTEEKRLRGGFPYPLERGFGQAKYLTLSRSKGTYLRFEMNWVPRVR